MSGESDQSNPLNSTLQRLDLTLGQQTATAVSGLNLPTFSGKPLEDIFEFLTRFKLATFALSDKHRCLALNKCLATTANTWAKTNIKKTIIEGQWKLAKKALIDRFGPADVTLKYRERLSLMKYENNKDMTLIGYVEKYVALYKKAYKSHTDADAIISLRLNLPASIIKNLNLLDDSWSSLAECDQLYKLIRRYEENIMPFEDKTSQPGMILGKDGVKELLDQLRSEFKTHQKPPEHLGAIKAEQPQIKQNLDRFRYQRYNNNFRGKPRYLRGNYNCRYEQRPNQEATSSKIALEGEQKSSQDKTLSSNDQVIDNKSQRPNKPPSPCYFCNGDHWNSDCSKRQDGLK